MLKVVVRHVCWEEGIEIGNFQPSEIENIVKLVDKYGAISVEGNDDLDNFSYHSSRLDLDKQCFEIIVG